MAGYSELIKNFEKIRSFTRDIFVYGYKGRSDYSLLSPRSYDNERRRIESYLSELVIKNRDCKGTTLSISSNTTAKTLNPLFKVWQTKSFTKKDCFLHFVLLDILSMHESLGVSDITEIIYSNYIIDSKEDLSIDTMTIRNKLNEYSKLGIFQVKKCGKTYYYYLEENPLLQLSPATREALASALSYYKNLFPAGFIGHSLNKEDDSPFIYRQIFFSQILDDELLLQILKAIKDKLSITVEMVTTKNNRETKSTVIPVKVLSNTKTGRRYIAVYSMRRRKFSTLRLDYIKAITFGNLYADYDFVKTEYEGRTKNSFSIMHQTKEKLHNLKMLLSIDEESETYVIERIKREGKHGTLTKIATNLFEYSIDVPDTLEMVPWLRTFIGRIINLEGTENHVITQFKRDLNTLISMYSAELD